MLIRSIKTFQFRNIVDGSYYLEPGVNLLVGRNGQGKTNLIEAISLLAQTKSFRTSDSRELVKWQCSQASVFAEISSQDNTYELGIIIDGSKRKAVIDGNNQSSVASLIGKLLCVSFTPYDLELISGPAGNRRKFIDRHAAELQQSHIVHYVNYHRALKAKAQLLREGRTSNQQLDVWDEILANHGANIMQIRQSLLELMQPVATRIYSELANSEEQITIRIANKIKREKPNASELLSFITSYREKERLSERVLAGPHRDDIEILLNGHEARLYASQGQARSIVLAMKLAIIEVIHSETGESPVVLLDDVNSELDAKRVEALFKIMLGHESQILVTGTDISLQTWKELGAAKILNVEKGVVS